MSMLLRLTILLVLCLAQAGEGLCADTLTNIPRPAAPGAPAAQGLRELLVPGALVRLPDGRQTRIIEVLPEGIRTELGVTLTPEGVVEGAAQTAPVTVLEPATLPAAPTPETARATTPQTPEAQKDIPQTVRPEAAQTPETPAPQNPERAEVPVPAVPQGAGTQRTVPTVPEGTPHQLTIVELLPMTPAPEQRKAEKAPAKEEPKAAPAPTPEKKKAAPAKEAKPREKPAKAPKPKEPATPKSATKKPAIGEELRIPPEAVSTGNLDFLEGCWQGTRPEYYSKRIIKECFCFGANGGAGKRRVIDSLGGRMCIGSSRAKLSKDGVLSVTSSGAACTDGERWGQAEMVCRGTGQRAPCTWVFKDAQGGRQSYEIPFVRVESCGR